MTEINVRGIHSMRSHGTRLARVHLLDWIVLVLLVATDCGLNAIEPFHRYLSEEMLTPDIRYPFNERNTVPVAVVPVFAVILPWIVFLIYYYHRRDVYDLHYASMGILYAVLITAVITDAVKVAVGRPRPNFYYRCFPQGLPKFDEKGNVNCTGNKGIVAEGFKSFPSGHTSWSFAGLGFLSWYLFGKLRVFDRRGHAARFCIPLLPLVLAALIGISRVDDYWHHWTDVFTGAVIGSVIAALCYIQFFPLPHDLKGWAPFAFFRMLEDNEYVQFPKPEGEAPHLRHNAMEAMEMGTLH